MVTSRTQPCNLKGSLVYNLGFCLAVLYLQVRRGLDLILVVSLDALAGRVGNVVGPGLLRPRS